jgi:mannose-6-phosphate isomerase-like protein (cupin superfamily)
MAQLKIIKADEVPAQNLRGLPAEAGQIKRVIATEKLHVNVDEVSPGYSPHHWHRHTKYTAEGVEVEYAPDFEEIYFVLSGRGVMQWKSESGEVREQEVAPGDTIHMPAGVVEHQLLNNGNEKLRIVVVGVPPPRRRRVG